MKNLAVILILMILSCQHTYNYENKYSKAVTIDASDISNSADEGDEREDGEKVDSINKVIIAKALCVEEANRNIRFILNCLNTIHAGQIQSAELTEVNNEKVLCFVAEDGTNYQIYLSGSGNVEAVKNLDTGEWPIKSTQ